MDYHGFLAEFPNIYMGHGPSHDHHISLTFDDGPGEATPRLLAMLDALSVKATFFCLGEAAHRRPSIVRAIVDGGHTLGSHGQSHVDGRNMSIDAFWKEQVQQAATVLEDISGRPVTLFRPPYGEITFSQVEKLAFEGHTLVGWSLDPKDWQATHDPTYRDRVVGVLAEQVHPGAIVLLHDGDDERGAARHAIVDIVTEAVNTLRSEWSFTPISSWINP